MSSDDRQPSETTTLLSESQTTFGNPGSGDQVEDKPLSSPHIPLRRKIGYSSYRLLNVITSVQGYFLTFFLLDAVNLNGYYVGTLLWIKKVFDALTDPLVGILSDQTNSPWGRRKPWIWLSTIPFALTWVLVWLSIPALSSSTLAKFWYYLLINLLFSFLSTCVLVPLASFTPVMAPTRNDQTLLAMWGEIFGLVGSILGSFLTAELIILFPTDSSPESSGEPDYQKGFLLSAGCFVPVLLIIPLLSAHSAVEDPHSTEVFTQESHPVRGSIIRHLSTIRDFFAIFWTTRVS